MSDDKKTISQGYLKLTTVHPEEGIIGYMNIKHRKGVRMTVNIPIEGQIFFIRLGYSEEEKEINSLCQNDNLSVMEQCLCYYL